MAIQKQSTASLPGTRALIIAFAVVTIAVVGYSFYVATRTSVDDFSPDLNIKQHTVQSTIKDQVAPTQYPGQ